MQMYLFFGSIVLHASSQNHDVIMKSVNSQIMSNEEEFDTHSVDSFRYESSFEVIAKICFILIDSLYRNDNMSDFQLYFSSVWESKISSSQHKLGLVLHHLQWWKRIKLVPAWSLLI